jgi:hypothetical protein
MINQAIQLMANGSQFLSLHLSESEETRDQEEQFCKGSPVEFLVENGLLTRRTVLVHCGYLNDAELETIREAGSIVVICPLNCTQFNQKVIDIEKLRALGVRWAIGTDGLATGKSLHLAVQLRHLISLGWDATATEQLYHISSAFHKIAAAPLPLGLHEGPIGSVAFWQDPGVETLDEWMLYLTEKAPKIHALLFQDALYYPRSIAMDARLHWSSIQVASPNMTTTNSGAILNE